ncbi:VOC family protein [Georgenia wangjunii]|uniref:VOC family protein n=1 Tax=Georgenia wangjunii TaxID=3117730 RepID=UPI002F264217
MPVRWYSVVIDCRDVKAQAAWWREAIDWRTAYEADDEVVLVPPHVFVEDWHDIPPEQRGPGLVFVPVPEGKEVKNRLHLDLAPGGNDDQEAEVQRLLDLGASRVDVGQGDDVSWVVLADPEGNEFCVLSPRDD